MLLVFGCSFLADLESDHSKELLWKWNTTLSKSRNKLKIQDNNYSKIAFDGLSVQSVQCGVLARVCGVDWQFDFGIM